MENIEELKDRSFSAIRYWIALAVLTTAITFVLILVLTHPTLERSIATSALAGIIVFSGFFFRSFGKDKEKYKRVSKSAV